MNIRRIICAALSAVGVLTLFNGCGTSDNTADRHEPVTMMAPFRNISKFLDVLNEKYPEVELEIIPYSGANMTAYVCAQLKSGDMPDIYCTTLYAPGREDLSDRLVDLSGYAFTDNYSEIQLHDVMDNGAIYLLPTFFNCLGITYNKTLLEANGWELPASFAELEELAPKVEAAGYELCVDQIQLPGYGFQYFCNILDTEYLNTPDGRKWQRDFVSGKATLGGSAEMIKALSVLDKWRSVGMLNGNGNPASDEQTKTKMAEGNTLFMLGASNVFSEGESDCEFGLMPYLSEDGTRNSFILNVSRYVGLNKRLEQPGSEQKLEDAVHVMEVLSTVEGMMALNSQYSDTMLLPLKDFEIGEDNYYKDIEGQLNAGYTAPFIYFGWEDAVVPIGERMISYIKGECELEEVITAIDESQHLLSDNSDAGCTRIVEKIPTDDCARLVGIAFAKAAGADLSIVSLNKWYDIYDCTLNLEGVCGELYPLTVTDNEITSILPTGWRGNIKTVTLSGRRIKELAETGYDRNGNGLTFPYKLVTPDGMELSDDRVYTAVITGVTDEVAAEGSIVDTGILGLDAAREYLGKTETFAIKDITWDR